MPRCSTCVLWDRKIDHLTVAETLRAAGQLERVGGVDALDELTGWVPAAGHSREYGRIVRENSQLRDLLTKTYEILGLRPDSRISTR
jgi:replicative DNA helicase